MYGFKDPRTTVDHHIVHTIPLKLVGVSGPNDMSQVPSELQVTALWESLRKCLPEEFSKGTIVSFAHKSLNGVHTVAYALVALPARWGAIIRVEIRDRSVWLDLFNASAGGSEGPVRGADWNPVAQTPARPSGVYDELTNFMNGYVERLRATVEAADPPRTGWEDGGSYSSPMGR